MTTTNREKEIDQAWEQHKAEKTAEKEKAWEKAEPVLSHRHPQHKD